MTALDAPGPSAGPGHRPTSTDSRRKGTLSDRLGRFGIDTVDAFVRTTDDVFDALPLQRQRRHLDRATGEVSEFRPTTSEVELPNGVLARATRRRGVTGVLASFSVPRWLRRDNRQPATAHELRTVVSQLVAQLGKFVVIPTAPEIWLQRVDLARDFAGVPSPARVLDAVSFSRPHRKMVTNVYRDAALAGAQTVYRKNSRWTARIYHRGEMYREASGTGRAQDRSDLAASEDGVLRFEAELRGATLNEAGLTSLESIDAEQLWQAASKYWSFSGFGRPIGTDGSRLGRAQAELCWKDLSLVMMCRLFPDAQMSPTTARKARALADASEVTTEDLRQDAVPAGHLDFGSGRFIDGEPESR